MNFRPAKAIIPCIRVSGHNPGGVSFARLIMKRERKIELVRMPTSDEERAWFRPGRWIGIVEGTLLIGFASVEASRPATRSDLNFTGRSTEQFEGKMVVIFKQAVIVGPQHTRVEVQLREELGTVETYEAYVPRSIQGVFKTR